MAGTTRSYPPPPATEDGGRYKTRRHQLALKASLGTKPKKEQVLNSLFQPRGDRGPVQEWDSKNLGINVWQDKQFCVKI